MSSKSDQRHANASLTAYLDRIASLPEWSELPEIPLYMDQVIILLNKYLYPDQRDHHDEKALTPSMINNYIKSRLLPPTVRKRYYRYHLAALLMICSLKESVAISDIPRLLKHLGTEEGIRADYDAFLNTYKRAYEGFQHFYRQTLDTIRDSGDSAGLILDLAISANLCKTMTNLCIRDDRGASDAGSPTSPSA